MIKDDLLEELGDEFKVDRETENGVRIMRGNDRTGVWVKDEGEHMSVSLGPDVEELDGESEVVDVAEAVIAAFTRSAESSLKEAQDRTASLKQ